MNGDYGSDLGFFDGGDPDDVANDHPAFAAFRENDGTDYHDDAGGNTTDDYDVTDGVIRYGRFGDQDSEQHGELGAWPGGPDDAARIADQRAREATDTGNRNIRRIAEQRSGSPTSGQRDTARVANSLRDAGTRIKRELTNDEPVERVVRQYTRRDVVAAPTFQRTEFEASLTAFKANTNGEWLVTLKVPNEQTESAMPLTKAFGLGLDVTITRKQRGND